MFLRSQTVFFSMERRTRSEATQAASTGGESVDSVEINLPSKYAEIDRIEDGYAVILFFQPQETENLTEFPLVDRVNRAKISADELPDRFVERDRFRIVPAGNGDMVVSTDSKSVGLKHDQHLTESVKRLTETEY